MAAERFWRKNEGVAIHLACLWRRLFRQNNAGEGPHRENAAGHSTGPSMPKRDFSVPSFYPFRIHRSSSRPLVTDLRRWPLPAICSGARRPRLRRSASASYVQKDSAYGYFAPGIVNPLLGVGADRPAARLPRTPECVRWPITAPVFAICGAKHPTGARRDILAMSFCAHER